MSNMSGELKRDCEILGIDSENIDAITIREVIKAYRKEALKVHPDKIDQESTDEERAKATAAFQELNNSYGRVLKLVLQKKKDKEETFSENNEEGDHIIVDDDEQFVKDNFENCNFPHENSGSFTVTIQHTQAGYWQACLEDVYGQPHIEKNDRGTECDRYWKFKYEFEGNVTDITVHIYNNPKSKKSSKLLIQGGEQYLICLYVFNVLPKIYKDVCRNKPKVVVSKRSQPSRSMVSCGQCKVKATLTDMKMHLKTAHSNSTVNQPKACKKKQIKANTVGNDKASQFLCDICGYKAKERKTLMQHIDAIHLIPWNSRMEKVNIDMLRCSKCEFVTNNKEDLRDHVQLVHVVENEMLLIERAVNEEEIEIEEIELEDEESIKCTIEERECPTPIPDSIYICAECNSGFDSSGEVEAHMQLYHQQISPEEKIRRLESELRIERGQHQDHLQMLKDTLKEASTLRNNVEQLEAIKSSLEGELEDLKKDSTEPDLHIENTELKKAIDEKNKLLKKSDEKHAKEVEELKKQQMQTSEALRSTVLERENLRESDRILLNTLDMMKIYVDQVKERESTLSRKHFQCEKCDLSTKNMDELKGHQENMHSKEIKSVPQKNRKEQDEGLVYCCTKCKFETKTEKSLTEHIKIKHESFDCEECNRKLESRSKLKEHKKKEHTVKDCDICNFETYSKRDLEHHVLNKHNKMFKCDKCNFEATSSKVLKEHVRTKHQTDNDNNFSCVQCGYKTILEHNLDEHIEFKHVQEKVDRSSSGVRKSMPDNIPCIYWNHGNCKYGMECKFSHVEIDACVNQDECRKHQCPMYHYNKSLNNFLGRRPMVVHSRK